MHESQDALLRVVIKQYFSTNKRRSVQQYLARSVTHYEIIKFRHS